MTLKERAFPNISRSPASCILRRAMALCGASCRSACTIAALANASKLFNHFAFTCWFAMEGIVRREEFLQLSQASSKHNALQTVANERETYPIGRVTASTAGLKTKPNRSKATVVVYCVLVDFC